MASDIWLRTILIVRKETRCRHIGYSFRLIARVLLYAPSHRHDSTYHGLCYTSRVALAGTRNIVNQFPSVSQCSWLGICRIKLISYLNTRLPCDSYYHFVNRNSSSCYRFQSYCSYSSAGGPPYSLPPFFFPVPDRGTSEGRYLCL